MKGTENHNSNKINKGLEMSYFASILYGIDIAIVTILESKMSEEGGQINKSVFFMRDSCVLRDGWLSDKSD